MTYTESTVTIFTTEDGQEFKTEGEVKRHLACNALSDELGYTDAIFIIQSLENEKIRKILCDAIATYRPRDLVEIDNEEVGLFDNYKPDVQQKAESVGWVEWTGGKRPVYEHTLVSVRLGGGLEEACEAGDLDWSWANNGGYGDIVAYRVISD